MIMKNEPKTVFNMRQTVQFSLKRHLSHFAFAQPNKHIFSHLCHFMFIASNIFLPLSSRISFVLHRGMLWSRVSLRLLGFH